MSRILSHTKTYESRPSSAKAIHVTEINSTKSSAASTAYNAVSKVNTQLFGPNTSISGGRITVNLITDHSSGNNLKRLRPINDSSDSSQETEWMLFE